MILTHLKGKSWVPFGEGAPNFVPGCTNYIWVTKGHRGECLGNNLLHMFSEITEASKVKHLFLSSTWQVTCTRDMKISGRQYMGNWGYNTPISGVRVMGKYLRQLFWAHLVGEYNQPSASSTVDQKRIGRHDTFPNEARHRFVQQFVV